MRDYKFLRGLLFLLLVLVPWCEIYGQAPTESSSSTSAVSSRTLDQQNQLKANVDTLVVCPVAFRSALKPWLEYRNKQGHRIQVVEPRRTAFELKQLIRGVAQQAKELKHLVLVGDAFEKNAAPNLLVPTEYVLSRSTVKFGAEPEIATDNPFADLDGDRVPELSVGRIPVDSSEELAAYVAKVIDYESSPPADWQTRMNFVAGVGGFGKFVDSVIEEVAKKVITEMVPGYMQTSMTYGSWSSPYCPNPELFSASAVERFNEGCLFWVYIGHGERTRLDHVHMPDQSHMVLDSNTVKQLQSRSGHPIAVFLACYTNAFDSDEDCLGEQMLRQPGGPVATIGGSRVTMPAGMGLFSMALLDEYFGSLNEVKSDDLTLGQLVRNAKRELASGQREFGGYRKLIQSVATSLLPKMPFSNERQDHVELMQLLGDPLLRVKRAKRIQLSCPETATAGEAIDVSGIVDAIGETNGTVKVQVCYQRDRLKQRFKHRIKYGSTNRIFANYQETYDQARDLVCMQVSTPLVDGRFNSKIVLPDSIRGECVVVCTYKDTDANFLGSAKIKIKKAR